MSKNTYFQGDPECDICGAPFFAGDEAIATEPCHFGRSGGCYCGLCYSFLMAMKNHGMTNTILRMQVLTTYLKEVEDTYPPEQLNYHRKGKVKSVDNVISAINLFREGNNGDD
tara:strand:+ start:212 stop:550 length:339 start_codon:yes stop_codon:yes gene_type:complete